MAYRPFMIQPSDNFLIPLPSTLPLTYPFPATWELDPEYARHALAFELLLQLLALPETIFSYLGNWLTPISLPVFSHIFPYLTYYNLSTNLLPSLPCSFFIF